jgi:NADH-quinone oxidoreductase subunit G
LPALFKTGFKVVQDVLPSSVSESADVLLPTATFAEKDGCWENFAGEIQPFVAAVPPPDGISREGDIYLSLLGRTGLYNAETIRHEMGEPFASIKVPQEQVDAPTMEFVEL